MCNCNSRYLRGVNIGLLALVIGVMYWSVFYIVGAVILLVGSIVDFVCSRNQLSYCYGWHVFMVISSAISIIGGIFWTHDICLIANTCRYCPDAFTQCVFTAIITVLAVAITIVETVILIGDSRSGGRCCCCSQPVPTTEVVLQPYRIDTVSQQVLELP